MGDVLVVLAQPVEHAVQRLALGAVELGAEAGLDVGEVGLVGVAGVGAAADAVPVQEGAVEQDEGEVGMHVGADAVGGAAGEGAA